MFVVGQLGATISADRKPFNKVLDSVFRDGGRQMAKLGRNMSAAISAPLIGAGALAIKTAADYETLRTSMDVLNGSAEEGARNFERLKEFSASTPFQLNDLASAQNMLQGFGQTADDAFDSIKMIGDISAVSGGSIEGIGIAFGQAAAEGKLMSRDIRQLINQGVPAIKLLADTMGVAESEIFDLASQGEISFEILQQSFRDATSEGGMFADGMAKQASTTAGLFSTLKDNVNLALGDIGETLIKEMDLNQIIKDLTRNIQTGIKWFSGLSSTAKTTGFAIAGIATVAGPTIWALGTLARSVNVLLPLVPKLAAGMKALTATMMANPYIAVGAAILAIGTYAWRTQSRINDLTASIQNVLDTGFDAQSMEEFQEVIIGIEDRLQSMRDTASSWGVDPESFESYNELQQTLDEVIRQRDQLAASKITVADPQETREVADEMDRVAESIERVRVAADTPTDTIIDPADIANIRVLREDFREFDNVLYNVLTHTEDFSHRLTETGETATGFGDDTERAARRSAMAMGGLANSLGGVVGQLIAGKKEALSFGNIMSSVAPALINVLTGGSGGFVSSLVGGLFGGFRSNGGDVMTGSSYVVGENGREIFSPSTNGSITPITSGGGGLTQSQVKMAFSQAFSEHVGRLGPDEFYMLSQKGRSNY